MFTWFDRYVKNKNQHQSKNCKKKSGNLFWAMSKHFLAGQRNTDLQAKDNIGYNKTDLGGNQWA
jgi:hypothetical protein